jgi:hypothetical protein
MWPRQMFSIALIIFVLTQAAPIQAASPDAPDANVPHNSKLVVYYFHGDMRCSTCRKFESYTKQALETYFADEIASGQILWQVLNVDRKENSHYVDDYKLITRSVVLSQVTDGKETRWQNLDQIWKKVRDKKDYMLYIKESINKFREEKSK